LTQGPIHLNEPTCPLVEPHDGMWENCEWYFYDMTHIHNTTRPYDLSLCTHKNIVLIGYVSMGFWEREKYSAREREREREM